MKDEKGKEEAAAAAAADEKAGTDLISAIESDLTLLVQIMSASIHYISTKSAHVQMNADIPQYNPVGSGQVHASKFLVDQETMAESIEELSDDLVGKVKDIERLVGQLPQEIDDQSFQLELNQLQQQIAGVNEEYRSALSEAVTLKEEMDTLLHDLCDDYQATREKLATSAKVAHQGDL